MRKLYLFFLCFFLFLGYGHTESQGEYGATRKYLKRAGTDIKPTSTNTYNLGSSDKKWSNVHVTTVNATAGDFSTVTSTNVVLRPQEKPDYLEGRLYYSSDNYLLKYTNNESDIELPVSDGIPVYARNDSGSDIAKGKVVYISGVTGQVPTIGLALADSADTSKLIGVTMHTIENNSNGYILAQGISEGIVNTSAFTAGDLVYISTFTAGGLTNTQPVSPNAIVLVGMVLYSHATQGKLYINPNHPVSMCDISCFDVTSPQTNDILTYNGTCWVNKSSATLHAIESSPNFVFSTTTANSGIFSLKIAEGTGNVILENLQATNSSGFRFKDSAAATKMVMLNNGNFGIGETNPSDLLFVQASQATLRNTDAGNLVAWKAENTSSSGKAGYRCVRETDFDWQLYGDTILDDFIIRDNINSKNIITIDINSTANSLCISSNGYVGIFTALPAYSLDITGNTRINSTRNPTLKLTNNFYNATSTSTIDFEYTDTPTNKHAYIKSYLPGGNYVDLQFYTTNSGVLNSEPTLVIKGNDTVGISTGTPQATLDVGGAAIIRGNITTEGMIRQASTWHVYGGTEAADATIAVSDNAWEQISNATQDLINLEETDGFSITLDSITITNAGDYTGSLSLAISGTATKDYRFRVYNVTQAIAHGYYMVDTTTGAGNYVTINMPIYLKDIAANDVIVFQVYGVTDGTDITLRNMLFEIHYLHD